MVTNLLLCGVGGQGIITASEVIAEAALLAGCRIKKSEVHGMSQRGGNVESHVRFSRDADVHSPLIPRGEVDVLLAFELLEALRGLPMTRPDALVIADNRRIVPVSVTGGAFEYPADPAEDLAASGRRVHVIEAFRIACEVGEPRAANIVLLGAAGRFLDLDAEAWTEAIRRSVPPKALDINLRAFEAGHAALDDA